MKKLIVRTYNGVEPDPGATPPITGTRPVRAAVDPRGGDNATWWAHTEKPITDRALIAQARAFQLSL